MSRLAFAISLFSIGFIVAFLFIVFSNANSEIGLNRGKGRYDVKLVKGKGDRELEAKRSRLSSTSRLLQILSFSIEEGTIESLGLLKDDSLAVLPNYKSIILPELKRETLSVLVSKFSNEDWEDWPNSHFSKDGRPTEARQFVDDMNSVNKDIGPYLESSSYLLHKLYSKTKEGKPLYARSVLRKVIFKNKKRNKASIKSLTPPFSMTYYDDSVLEDTAFRATLEKKRCELTIQSIDDAPRNVLVQIKLIRELEPRYCSFELGDRIEKLLTILSLDASRKFRSQVLFDKKLISVIESLLKTNPNLKSVVSNFYLVGALDALESGAFSVAEKFVDLSIRLYPHLSSQNKIKKAIRYHKSLKRNKVVDVEFDYVGNDAYKSERNKIIKSVIPKKPEKESGSEESGFWGGFFTVLFLIVCFTFILVIFLFFLNRAKRLN